VQTDRRLTGKIQLGGASVINTDQSCLSAVYTVVAAGWVGIGGKGGRREGRYWSPPRPGQPGGDVLKTGENRGEDERERVAFLDAGGPADMNKAQVKIRESGTSSDYKRQSASNTHGSCQAEHFLKN